MRTIYSLILLMMRSLVKSHCQEYSHTVHLATVPFHHSHRWDFALNAKTSANPYEITPHTSISNTIMDAMTPMRKPYRSRMGNVKPLQDTILMDYLN